MLRRALYLRESDSHSHYSSGGVIVRSLCVLVGAALLVAGCGRGVEQSDGNGRPTIVVTTSILGDVVAEIVGDDAEVVTIMPVGASPHDFQSSAREAAQIRDADALIVNGGGLEESLVDVIAGAVDDGVPTFEALDAVEALHDDHEDDDHEDDDHEDDDHEDDGHGHDDHDHGNEDPHFFTDPVRMAEAVEGITDFLVDTVPALDGPLLHQRADRYRAALEDLDLSIVALFADLSPSSRVLVTNHEVFAYFAERYDFTVIGTVIPGSSTTDAASAGDLAALADAIERGGVPAIFADTSSPDRLARTLADEIGDVTVVELFSESLGSAGSGAETYVEMIETNATRIADALR
ncbi:metal ABC transporter solute-binding protein, Zn/Mn family [Actinospongicola halichondriae]|uniref:metal ABC transporter solute-binding protein, Zn/Mn family n=1 Tax=Actinospongicola halichondriae TaxID=3236844 RepID=UPI003D46CF0A